MRTLEEKAQLLYEAYYLQWDMMTCRERSDLIVSLKETAGAISLSDDEGRKAILYLETVADSIGINIWSR